jgi:hypothetical protein
MSLPSGGPWPPPPHGIALAQQSMWSAWYVGDPETLASVYGAVSGMIGHDFFQRQGGILPAIARLFWGRPTVSGQRRAKLHVPLAADIATASADLLFSEPPQFLIAGEAEAKKTAGKNYTPSKAQARLDEILNQGTFHATLLEAAELVAALGGGWLQQVWDTQDAQHVMINTVPADFAIGEWRWGKLDAVTFFTEYMDAGDSSKSRVYRHLEKHEPGRILHGLYLGDGKSLGHPEPLADHPSTLPYAGLIDEEGGIATGVKGLTAAYIPNMKPQRRWRKIEELSDMGRSDYDGVEPLMDALDEAYTSWMRDLRLGKARLMVPEEYLKDLGKGQGAAFEEDQEIFTQLKMLPKEKSAENITAQQFQIRVNEHKATADQLIDHILESAGYSLSTFGRGGEAMKTATEVVSRERQSERTRDKKTRYWSQGFEPFLTTWLEVDALVFGSGAKGEVTVQWPDASQPDREVLARTSETLRRAEAASTLTLVRMQHPDWTEEQITEEVAAIQAEGGRAVPSLEPFAPAEEV